MTIPHRAHLLAYALALGVPGLVLGLAAVAQQTGGPACVELPDDEARPGLDMLETAAPQPACIRVRLAEAR